MPLNIDQHLDDLVRLRHHLHSIAEVSGSEKQTAKAIANFLEETDPDKMATGVGGHGILATYQGKGGGSHVLLRCELDALPIPDVNEVDYRSQTDGVSHKCGHDGHMAILCGIGRVLGEHPFQAGKVTLLFQPSEETGQGARQVIGDEHFKKLNPDYCFALHNLPGFTKHQVIVREDVFAAASIGLIIRLKGQSAHASHPEEGTSPALAMAQLVQAFSSVPQFYSPLERGVKITVVHASLGERAFGTSPAKATVMATLRTYDDELLEQLKERCLKLAVGMAQTYGLSVDWEWTESFRATKNSREGTEIIRSAARELDLDIQEKEDPFSWSEDFGHFTEQINGGMFGLGIGENHPALHAENYNFEDDMIPTGVSMFMEILNQVAVLHE